MGLLGATESSPVAYINGKKHKLPLGKAEVTLLQYLRGECSQLIEAECLLTFSPYSVWIASKVSSR